MAVVSIIKEKSFSFSIEIVELYKILSKSRREYVMSKQLLRSATSVGANVREALNGESTADFIHKLAIAQKECDESLYWLELLEETGYLEDKEYARLQSKGEEMLKIIRSIIITSKKKKTHNS